MFNLPLLIVPSRDETYADSSTDGAGRGSSADSLGFFSESQNSESQ